MDGTVIIAVVTGVCSLVVAVVSLITAIVTNRTTARTSRELERMKQDFEASQGKRLILDDETKASMESLTHALRTIQHLKDEIQLVLSAVGSSLSASEAQHRIEEARQAIFKLHEDGHPHLNSSESRTLHSAKNLALHIQEVFVHSLPNASQASELQAGARAELQHLRQELTDLQHALRDYRQDRLFRQSIDLKTP